MNETVIVLVRHAESVKNLGDIHGGKGMQLTPKGREQCAILVGKMKSWGINKDNAVLLFSESVQTKETAELIEKQMGMPSEPIKGGATINLGVASGLSNDEVKHRFPEVYNNLVKWRNKEIEIADLHIPGMESAEGFFNRGLTILSSVRENCYNIFVVTTSLFILLANILLGKTVRRSGGYKHMDVRNAEIALFRGKYGDYAVDSVLTEVLDVLERQ